MAETCIKKSVKFGALFQIRRFLSTSGTLQFLQFFLLRFWKICSYNNYAILNRNPAQL